MRKLFVSLVTLTTLFGGFSAVALPGESSSCVVASASAQQSITVYLIKQVGGNAWSTTSYKAIYDSDANTITVGKFTYNIHENRAYGQENDGRSEYRYVAGNYYFNL